MIGLDTVFFTREGFKKLRDLNLYDEVLTPLGMFEPIMKMSRIKDIDYYMKVATDEVITCSNDLELPVYDINHKEKMVSVDSVKDNKYYTTKILSYDSDIRSKEDLYEIGTSIPKEIGNKRLVLSSYHRFELFCGLMDTPICELKSKDGIYDFYPHSYEFEKDLIALARLFGFAVRCGSSKGHRYVKIGIQNISLFDDIPIRDTYRDIEKMPPDNRFAFMPIKDTGTLKNSVQGREISVKNGLALVGYSLIPIKCQVL